jgi:molybdopterin molybdotransferase
MLSVEESLDKIISNTKVLEAETRPLLESQGQVLVEDIFANIDIPPLDNSAMDGYAVRSEDTLGASLQSPRVLRVIDTVIAGMISQHRIIPGTTIRIMTGAPIPSGADGVIRFEDTDKQRAQNSQEVSIYHEVRKGANMRKTGEDISRGSVVISKGTVIKPVHIGLMASLGKSRVTVFRKPRIAILATGNEIVETDQPLPPGKLYNSNSYSIAALVARYGGIPDVLGIAKDTEDSLVSLVYRGINADMLISTGGVSEGDFDIVKEILAKEGRIIFWKVRMKPGKPMVFGILRVGSREVPYLGLPGNPVSAMINFEIFARPAILKMSGKTRFGKAVIKAVLEDTVKNEDGRRVYARAIVDRRNNQYFARTTGPQGSNILTSMSLANGLAIVPEDISAVKPGDVVDVIMLDWSGEEY